MLTSLFEITVIFTLNGCLTFIKQTFFESAIEKVLLNV